MFYGLKGKKNKMKCPFRKEEIKTDKFGRIIEYEHSIHACTTISFGDCYGHNCAAYNPETGGCKLIERRLFNNDTC